MQDLGIFPGAIATGPPCCNSINNQGEIVGISVDTSFTERAVVWRGNGRVDLNTLIPADSPLYLTGSESLNDSGQITGTAIVKSSCPVTTPPAWLTNQSACTEFRAFLATPIDPIAHPEAKGSREDGDAEADENSEKPGPALPENVRQLLQQRLRLGITGARLVRPH